MTKFFPQVFITGIALFLLLAAAGYGIATLQARSIPWDCSDWQAFAHSDRTTSILESLAANRGKTLYCAIDQSDTFTKAETWEAGKDRNERDDTVYQGEQGRFRGFIAAQEGWLTDGESGVTGQSIDRIFEFPREERRRGWKTKRITIRPDLERRVYTDWGQVSGDFDLDANRAAALQQGQAQARTRFVTPFGGGAGISYDWQALSEPPAMAACRARGAKFVEVTPSLDNSGGWEYNGDTSVRWYRTQARKTNTWTAVCKKRVRRTRR